MKNKRLPALLTASKFLTIILTYRVENFNTNNLKIQNIFIKIRQNLSGENRRILPNTIIFENYYLHFRLNRLFFQKIQLQIIFNISIYFYANISSPSKPKHKPEQTSRSKTKRFSLMCLFTLKRTRTPTPAPEKRPDNIVPTVIIPSE